MVLIDNTAFVSLEETKSIDSYKMINIDSTQAAIRVYREDVDLIKKGFRNLETARMKVTSLVQATGHAFDDIWACIAAAQQHCEDRRDTAKADLAGLVLLSRAALGDDGMAECQNLIQELSRAYYFALLVLKTGPRC